MRRTVIAAGCAAAVAVGAVTSQAGGRSSEPTWPLTAKLLGANERSQEGKRHAGDRDARGFAAVSGKSNKVCVALAYKDLDTPVGAHIHRGRPNQNGPIVVTLDTPQNGDVGASSSCHGISAVLFNELRSHPRRFYVNIHTEAFPNGAIRGQLRRG